MEASNSFGKSALTFQSETKIKEEQQPVEFYLNEGIVKCEVEEEIEPPPLPEEYPVFDIQKSIKCEEEEESESFELPMPMPTGTDPLSLENFDTPTSTSQDQGQVQFICGHCQTPFLEESTLISHLSTHNEELKLFNCSNCNQRFKDPGDLERHARVHDPGQSYTGMSDFLEHLKTLNKQPSIVSSIYICQYCSVQCSSKEMLQKHLLIHTGGGTLTQNHPNHNCTKCDRIFASKKELTTHLKNDIHEKLHMCPRCSKSFYLQIELNVHFKQHHTKKRQRNSAVECAECPKCDKIFSSEKELTTHLKNYNHWKLHVCVECSKSFYLQIELDVHFKRYHAKEKPYTCETCNRSFVLQNSLVLHRLLHTGEKPFKCNKCDRSYLDSHNLKIHERSHATPLSQRLL